MPQIASVLKADFVTYLPTVMDMLLKDAAKSVDMKVVSAKEAELENQDEEEQKTAENQREIEQLRSKFFQANSESRKLTESVSVLEAKV